MRFTLALLVLLGGRDALAEPAAPEAPPFARLWLTGGAASRTLTQSAGDGLLVRGLAPTSIHLSGAWFFKPWLGLAVEGRSEVFWAIADDGPEKVPLSGVSLAPMATFRWQAHRVFSLEGQAGWSLAARPVISLATGAPQAAFALHTGPIVGGVAQLAPASAFSAQLFVRLELAPLASLLQQSAGGLGLSGGAQVRVGAWQLGPLTLGVGATYELSAVALNADAGNASQLEHRFGLGLALEGREAVAARPTTGRLVGRVVRAGGAPVAGARVMVEDATFVTGADGRFDAGELPAGAREVRASAKGLKPATRTAQLTAGARVEVQLQLEAPTGPGRITGVVRAAPANQRPLKGARVAAEGGVTAETTDDGAFTLERVGPGPVKVTVSLAGFAEGEEVVQVPAEGVASVELSLQPKGAKAKATVRGLVRGVGGAAIKATIRVQELKLKLSAKADGRFVTEIPGGHYTLVIEAPGYVTQTKVLDVADGDQAIFHADLEKAR